MFLHRLWLQNFRNHQDLHLSFSCPTTLILGPNGSGKTNLLEAIYLLATGKSFRADRQEEMINYSADLARIKTSISPSPSFQSGQNDGEKTQLEILITRGTPSGQSAPDSHKSSQRIPRKRYLVNDVPKLRKNFVGRLPAVLFGPHDLRLIDGSPSRRRSFLDQVLLQTSWEYRRSLLAYEQGLRQRNRLLLAIREGQARRQQLFFWDKLLTKNGQLLNRFRQQFLDFLNHLQPGRGELSRFAANYQPSSITESRLVQYAHQEIAAAATLVGPHRDDFGIRIQGPESRGQDSSRNLHKFGSRGEQRLAVLWLKTGELAFIKEKTQTTPLLLLDDIFSELDHSRRQLISQVMGKQQTLITAADEHLVEGIGDKTIAL